MRRHDLAYLHPSAAYQLLNAKQSATAHDALRRWVHAGRPLVVACQSITCSQQVLLGLARPPGEEPRRLSISVGPEAIRAIAPPLTLAHCLNSSTVATSASLRQLLLQCERQDIAVSVYGSLAWEILSGTLYRHSHSDIDLVIDITCVSQLAPCIEALQQAQAILPYALDGEIRFGNNAAVNWKELAQALLQPSAAQVVAKQNTGATLTTVTALMGQLQEHDHAR